MGLPAVPVLLGHAVLDRDDRVPADDVGPVVGHLRRRERAALAGEHVGAVARRTPIVAGSRAIATSSPGTRPAASIASSSSAERVLVRGEVGGEAALVADGDREPALDTSTASERVVGLRSPAQRLGEGGGTDGDDHELLEVDVVVWRARRRSARSSSGPAARGRRRRRRSGRAASTPRPRPPSRPRARQPRMALAPRRDLFGVPSRSISAKSIAALVECVEAPEAVGDLAGHVRHGLRARPCRRSGRRRRAARPPRRSRSTRRRGRSPGPSHRRRGGSSTSTVGLPRESRTSRASSWAIRLTAGVSPVKGVIEVSKVAGGFRGASAAARPRQGPPAGSAAVECLHPERQPALGVEPAEVARVLARGGLDPAHDRGEVVERSPQQGLGVAPPRGRGPGRGRAGPRRRARRRRHRRPAPPGGAGGAGRRRRRARRSPACVRPWRRAPAPAWRPGCRR